jgi:hypothetical protein
MEKVQIIPPPKDVDPGVLAWKGAAVLAKMDGIVDLWLTAADWVSLHCHLYKIYYFIFHFVTIGHSRHAWTERTLLSLVNLTLHNTLHIKKMFQWRGDAVPQLE